MREKILKFKILQLQKTESKKYSEIYLEFIKYFKKYFEKQALFYIASLDNLEILEKNDFEKDFLEKLKELLEKIYFLGSEEEKTRLEENLQSYWYEVPKNIILDNKDAIEYAKNHAWELIKQIDETTKNEMQDLISESLENSLNINQIAEKIKEKFDKYSTYRASLIAQQETAIAYSSASRKQNDNFTKKLWIVGWKRAVTQKDSNVRQTHLINEADGRIPKNQVYSWTGDDNSPFGFFCRCHIEYSLVNPETGLLYDNEEINFWWWYTDNQVENFRKNFWDNFWKLNDKQLNLQKKYWYTDEEILAIKSFSWNNFEIFNKWFKNNWFFSENKYYKQEIFNSWIKFLFWFLRKTPDTQWTFYRWHKVRENEFKYLKSLKIWDIYKNKTFFSSSERKEVAQDFFSENKVLFTIETKKAKEILNFSNLKWEKEVLFLPNQLFKVEKIQELDWVLNIFLKDLWK